MKILFLVFTVGALAASRPVDAAELVTGRVRFESGEPAAGVRVWLFDLHHIHTDPVVVTTDAEGHFNLPSTDRLALFALGPNYPNPFNPSTIIPYQLPVASYVRLDIFNVLGQRIKTLFNGQQAVGLHTAKWDGTDAMGRAVAAGVYLYRLDAEEVRLTQRMVLVDGPARWATSSSPPNGLSGGAGIPRYGLVISGRGIESYVDLAFLYGYGHEEVVVVRPAEQQAQTTRTPGGLLGDVNNDTQVDMADALLVLVYTLDRSSFVAPNQGRIGQGDVNEDCLIDLADGLLITTYVANPLDGTLPDGIGQPIKSDMRALVTLYEALGGDNWRDNTNWLSTEPFHTWYGVETNDIGRITRLRLDRNELTGTIPEALAQLKLLKHLDLDVNELTGTIPEALAQLKNLQTLDLNFNELTGTIPEALAQLENLRSLNLSFNELTGTIPEALTQLENLQGLNLNFNELTGTIPEALAQLENLQSLSLGGNKLTGTIPEALTQLENLQSLSLLDNELTGTIPEALAQLENLRSLSLSFNELTGTIPEALAQLENLWNLDLRDNKLTGTIPEALAQLKNLSHLNLSFNELTGTIPKTLGQLENLQELYLDSNELTGTIPKTLGQLENLKYLSLRNNKLIGAIPEELGQLKNLQELYLRDNELTGAIPEALGQLRDLKYLYLGGNELTGCIPKALQDIPNNDLNVLGLTFCP